MPIRRPLHLISAVLITLALSTPQVNANDVTADLFCGETWIDAFENCHAPCPRDSDADCPDGMACHGYTGCAAKYSGSASGGNGVGGGGSEISLDDDTYKNNMCGSSWLTAMLTCSNHCPPGKGCPPGQTCFAATNCDKPIEPIVSKLIMSLLGDYDGKVSMNTVERGVFSESILEFLVQKMEGNKVAIGGAGVTGQEFVEQGGRRLGERGLSKRLIRHWNDTVSGSPVKVEFSLNNDEWEEGRRLPTFSSALDVSMTITGEYRPPPYQDIDLLVEDSINRASAKVVDDLRRRGNRGGTVFFERVDDLSAKRLAAVTERPTKSPTDYPTKRPSESPTETPTYNPTTEPTNSPSDSPSRAFEQVLQSGSGPDLYVDTAKSFGNLFEVKTKSSSETVLVTGMDFYSSADAGTRVQYEVWTKEGTWQGFEGKLGKYTKIAEGEAKSKGACMEENAGPNGRRCNNNFVQIPFEDFTNVSIKGGGESRSFYVTLTTKDIMYTRGQGGASELLVQVETPDIELYKGAGVLTYPFTGATEDHHYTKPRGFLGRVWYERNPCKDGGNEWPCETRSPLTNMELSSKKPTGRPTPMPVRTKSPSRMPSGKPVSNPSGQVEQGPPSSSSFLTPTAPKPTTQELDMPEMASPVQHDQTPIPPSLTNPPSLKPVIDFKYSEADVMQSNIMVRLHNVLNEAEVLDREFMNEREQSKYSEVLMEYLRYHPSLLGASINVLNITVWHQEAVTVMKKKKKKKKEKSQSNDKGRGPKARKRLLRALRSLQEDGRTTVTTGLVQAEQGGGSVEEVLTAEESSRFPANEVGTVPEESAIAFQFLDEAITDKDYGNAKSMDVTTIIHTVNSILPADVTDVLLLHVIEDDDAELIDRFRAETLYTFFHDIGDISGQIIFNVTKPPTSAPTTLAQSLANVNSDTYSSDKGEEIKDKTRKVYLWVGVLVGVLWCILTLCSICQVLKARGMMNNERHLDTKKSRQTILKKGESQVSVFGNFLDHDGVVEKMDFTAKTHQLIEDMTSSGVSGGSACYDEEYQNGVRGDQTTFNDLFGRVAAASNPSLQNDSVGTSNEIDNKTKGATQCLQVKLSTEEVSAGAQFEDRLQKKLSNGIINPSYHQEEFSSEENSLSKVSERSGQLTLNRRNSTASVEERLQLKMNAKNGNQRRHSSMVPVVTPYDNKINTVSKIASQPSSAPPSERMSSFDERLQLKMRTVGKSATVSSSAGLNAQLNERLKKKLGASCLSNEEAMQPAPLQNASRTFNERLQVKLSQVREGGAPKDNQCEGMKEPTWQKRNTIAAAETSSQDSDKASDMQKPRPQRTSGNSKLARRSSTSDIDLTQVESSKKEPAEKIGKHSTAQRRRSIERADSGTLNHSKQPTKKAKEKRQNNEGTTRRPLNDKQSGSKPFSSGGNKNSKDRSGGRKTPSKDKDLGNNMVEMLFA